MKPRGVILSGGPESVHEAGSPRAPQNDLRRRRAGARHLLRPDDDGGAARRHGGGRAPSRIRPRRRGSEGAEPPVRRRLACRRALSGVDEPRRPHHQDAAGLPGGRRFAERAVRRHPGREAEILRRDVPPRGGAHAARRGAAAQFRAQDFRRQRRLDHARLQGRGDREDPRAGRQGPGDLRAVGRRRFSGRRRADPRGDRRAAHLRVRRSRPAAARRGARRSCTLFRDSYNIPLVHVAGREDVSRRARRRQRPGGEAQDHRQAVHRRVRGRGEENRRRRSFSRRARSIRT